MSIPPRSGASRRRPVFTTDAFRPAERFDAFNEEFSRRVMGLDVWRNDEGPFSGEVSVRLVGPLVCARMSTSPLTYARTPTRLQDGDDCIVLGIHTAGRSVLFSSLTVAFQSIGSGFSISNDFTAATFALACLLAIEFSPVLFVLDELNLPEISLAFSFC